jgi:ubiquinone biosynthesis protein Coq4
MPEGSTGRALRAFLEENGIDMLTHYERHDIKHVLFGYPPEEEGEVCLQSFMLGNGHLSFPVVATVLFGLLTMPFSWKAMRKAYRRGQHAASLDSVDWAALLPENLEAVRKRYEIGL